MFQSISTAVAATMSASIHSNPPLPCWGSGGRGVRGGRGGNPKQVAVPGNCKCCGKAGNFPIGTCTGTHAPILLSILLTRCIERRGINRMLLCHIALCKSAGFIIMPQVTALIRLSRLVLLVLVVMPLLMWMLLDVGRIRMMTSSHSLVDS